MYKSAEEDPAFSFKATIEFVNSLEKTVNDLGICTRRIDYYPFDVVAGEAMVKAFALCRSVIVLVQNGFPDEAFGLCRSLYELSIYLRYITVDPELVQERALTFLLFGLKAKGFWADILRKSDTLTNQQREDIERYIAENKIPIDPKLVTRPWSGIRGMIEKYSKQPHPTDAPDVDEMTRDRDRAVSYIDTSSYVHCTQPALEGCAFDWKERIVLPKPNRYVMNKIPTICMVIHLHLRGVVRHSLFGMNVLELSDLQNRRHPASDIHWNPNLHEERS